MTQKAHAFLEFLSRDESLRENAAAISEMPELLKLAREHGFALSAEDFVPAAGEELNEDELAGVSGAGMCGCFVGGGGKKEGSNQTCACVLAGFGMFEETKSQVRCNCVLGGIGDTF